MNKAHTLQHWKNKPDLSTPLNETNLNRLDVAVDVIDDRVISLDTTKADQVDMLQTISNITFDRATGIFTITRYNGTSFTIDTDLEKITINFDYDNNPSSPHYQQLILTLIDGTVKYIDLSALITQYEFVDSVHLHFTVDQDGKISATIIDGSITEDKLEPNFLANCRLEVSKAENYADESESWAKGTRNGVPVPSTDPAYQKDAHKYSIDAEAWANGTREGDPTSAGDPTYQKDAHYYSIHAREEAEAWANGTRSGAAIGPSDPAYNKYSKYWADKSKSDGEAWSNGTREGQPVDPSDPTYEKSAKYWANHAREEAEAWAVGERGGVPVPPSDETYNNNSKHFAGLAAQSVVDAEQAKDDAEAALDEINEKIQATTFQINFVTGELEYTSPGITFNINRGTGNLEWEVAS